MTRGSSALHQLASRVGILSEYVGQTERELRITPDDTRVAILAALGIVASSEREAARALEELEERERARPLAPVRALPAGSTFERAPRSELVLESGQVADPAVPIPMGYHMLHVDGHTQLVIAAPPTCVQPLQACTGLTASLYSLRSEHDWGVGDLTDLHTLAAFVGSRGGAFVGVNPLHALRNRGDDISPYRPVSRLYRNPIYIDVTAVPELTEDADARAMLDDGAFRSMLATVRGASRVHYEQVWELKRRVLGALHRSFIERHRGRSTSRGAAYAAYLAREGEALARFSLFCALDEQFASERATQPWTSWPVPFRDPQSPECAAFAVEHVDALDFHAWLQFEADRQLEHAQARAHESGLAIGLYQDLAIAPAPDSADVWAHQDMFVGGVSVGAPPDDYAPMGQNWGLPPIDPRRLRDTRYAHFIALLRASLRHSGALRIDHVLGFFRQFWIPSGMPGTRGAYVRFPTDDLFAILALESHRNRAVIVGEDLGTVPPEVPGTLRKWGVLSSRVMFFEREPSGTFLGASSYEPVALATADTHDMAPLAGYWTARDLELRRDVGLFPDAAIATAALTARDQDRRRLVELLAREGVLDATAVASPSLTLATAVHRFLCRTPSVMVGFALEDLAGESEPVNLPGVGPDRFPSWTRRLAEPIEAVLQRGDVAEAFPRCRPTPT